MFVSLCLCVCGVMAGLGASIAQLGERQTEDLKVSGSIPDRGIFFANPRIFVSVHDIIYCGQDNWTIETHAS